MINKILKNLWQKDDWFGEKNEFIKYTNGNSEEEIFLNILTKFKNGNFEDKEKLLDLINKSNNSLLVKLSIKLFCCVASNDDFFNLDFNIFLDDYKFLVFISYAKESISLQIIPYLLELLENIEGTDEGEQILYTIGYIIDYDDAIDTICSFEEVYEEYKNFIKKIDTNKYYYYGKEIFLGDLTKQLILETMYCLNISKKPFPYIDIPFILSINTGIKCPIQPQMIVNDIIVKRVFDYVDKISNLNIEKGNKYFYGYKI